MQKPNRETITYNYIDLFPCLNYLEIKRKGIKDRVWEWIIDMNKYDGGTLKGINHMNLFYFGPKDEVEKSDYVGIFDWVQNDIKDIELQKDIHLIWEEFVLEGDDIEMFYFKV